MRVLNEEELLKAINEGRKKNKRDGRDGVLLSVPTEYMQDKKYALKAQHQQDLKDFVELLTNIRGTYGPENVASKLDNAIKSLLKLLEE